MSTLIEERVESLRHWTDNLFSFRTTRHPSFRFASGQFTMLGLLVEGKPLLRAYSMASAVYEDTLEFFSIKVPDGPLTSRLQHLREGDRVLVSRKATGTLILDNLLPGSRVFLLGTGTGLAPFISIIKDPEVYDRFETIVLAHGCRHIAELAYGETVARDLPEHGVLGAAARNKLIYYPTVTREPFHNRGRITDLLEAGTLCSDLGLQPLDRETDRVMVCGSPSMLRDAKAMLEARGLTEGSVGEPGHFVIERAFVEK